MAEKITLWRGQKNSQHFTEDERQATRTQKEENTGRERERRQQRRYKRAGERDKSERRNRSNPNTSVVSRKRATARF
jgi:hypothetical protein